ncbi:alpha-N-acetylglucosaminidase [Odontomachus brunneus]|uniref:alpha-N-acetylglucosaminidase n=1 Tax=Odontomachus brunneus TaxID=486640 RepID=UPI0013F24C8B|nr:alpha-N-acetylglucosaminidase [Odontomachus brunneus]
MDVLMLRLLLSIIIFGLLVSSSSQYHKQNTFQNTLGHIKPHTLPEVQAEAAKDVARRLLGNETAKLFVMIVDNNLGPVDKQTFMITKNHLGEIEIRGTTGVAITWGLNYYLKNYCNVHVSWDGMQITLPNVLPEVRVKIISNDRFRYYQNVCTAGYSSAWWQWQQWEKNIDWMALNGINLALAFTAQEAIWQRLFHELNLTQVEIDEHFGGPAFLPWTRMGNIRGFGGPLSSNWHNRTVRLQHQILRRMRDLGIVPVLPAFAGYVPRAFARVFPNTNMTKIESWSNFEDDKYCCPYLLEPTDPLFHTIGEKFLRMYIDEFGTDHIYNCDTFNENEPVNSELAYLSNVSHSVFQAMTAVDPQAIWLMQGWLFVHNFIFWTEPRVKSLLTSVPVGRMLVLDLQSEQFPQYGRLKSYYGQPFIWCMLHNFGGTLGMFGSAQIINQRPFDGRHMNDSTMVGIGLTPEGINQNYVIYELMNEMGYRHEPVNLDAWFERYATRRYGAWNEYAVAAWKRLGKTVYNFVGIERIRGHYVITRRPSLNISPWVWYNREDFYNTWDTFLKARYGRGNNTLYRHDVVDITRQALQLMADNIYTNIVDCYRKRNITAFRSHAAALLDLFDDLEAILASGSNFLLGTWLAQAKDMAVDEDERQSYEYNARNQITLWGPNGEIRDYANKQWSGVVEDYFKPRWALFLEALEKSLVERTRINITEINDRMFLEVEQPFTFSTKLYPVETKGDTLDIATKIISKWLVKQNYSHVQRHVQRHVREENLKYNPPSLFD